KMISGIVRDCNSNEPLADAQVTMKYISGKNLQTKTGPDGKFSFDLTGGTEQNTLVINKEKYKEKSETVTIENINEADWKIDILQNKPLCMDTINGRDNPNGRSMNRRALINVSKDE